MKKIYFARHGESIGNASDSFQFDDAELSERGHEQSRILADRARRIDFDSLVTSTMPRALQTCTYIEQALGMVSEKSDLFVERRRPRAQQGLVRTSSEAVAMEIEIRKSARVSGYRYADEENFDDLVQRADKALEYLQSHPSNTIFVVTHGVFLRILVCRAIYSSKMTGNILDGFLRNLRLGNTGITIMRYDDPIDPSKWLLATWNDRAHLG